MRAWPFVMRSDWCGQFDAKGAPTEGEKRARKELFGV